MKPGMLQMLDTNCSLARAEQAKWAVLTAVARQGAVDEKSWSVMEARHNQHTYFFDVSPCQPLTP
eukprot:15454846-Alexandrium_andersonii.AAC.1